MLEENRIQQAKNNGDYEALVDYSKLELSSEDLLLVEAFSSINRPILSIEEDLAISPEEEFFITKFTNLIGQELAVNGLDRLAGLANYKIDLALEKFLQQDKSGILIPFISFVFLEFRNTKTEDEHLLSVIVTLLAKIIRLEKINANFEAEQGSLIEMASVDVLTRAFNRRKFEEDLPTIFDSERDSDQNLALIMFDLDHFKDVNDTYGHDVGDEVLKAISKKVKELIRDEDKLYRYGGEEFVILLQAHSRDEVKMIMDKIVKAVAEMPIKIGQDQEIKITLSMGGAIKQDALADPNPENKHRSLVMLKLADEVLYYVKHRFSGRNDSFMLGIDKKIEAVPDDENPENIKMWNEIGKSITFGSMIKAVFEGFKKKPKN